MTLRAIVVDDEPLARRRLIRLLREHGGVEVVAEAEGGDEAAGAVLRERPDVVFLDVRMPGASGLDALRALNEGLPEERRPVAVFTTAHPEHAVEAFELEGADYLLKPIERERLAAALARARRRRDARPVREEDAGAGGFLAALRGARVVSLASEEVACVTVEGGLTWARTARERLRLRATLGAVEARLPSPPFVRVSRAAIVALPWVEHLEPSGSGTYVARLRAPLDVELRVSRRRARALRRLLGW